ncbi:MAG: methyl-accepting chemotaxis protein [Deltaproteobacteria bacterium]|nr:methyl-accepting chemotaxis protein [Deltaproteobacteria bacterium]
MDAQILKFFDEESSMRNKLYLSFFMVVAVIIATHLLVGFFISDPAKSRAMFAFIGLAVGMLLGSLIANDILRNIGELVSATRIIGEGDLTQEVSVNTKDEIGELAGSFNQMVFNLREVLTQFRETSNEIFEASGTLSSFVGGINATAENIADISTRIAQGAEKQAALVESTFAIMKRMAASIQTVAEKSHISAEAAKKASETARRERESMEKTREELERVFTKIEDTTRMTREFGDKIRKITKIADIISGISEQTNLLSFNAAIEATRAGEFGKGFSVVSDEVRRLAEKSKRFTEEITAIIDEIQKDNIRVVSSLDEQTHGIEFGRKAVDTVVGGLVDITEKIIDMGNDVQEISGITQQQKNDAQTVVDNMENVSALAHEHLSATEETVKVAASQVASINEVVEATRNLSAISERLKAMALRFKLGMGTHEKASA